MTLYVSTLAIPEDHIMLIVVPNYTIFEWKMTLNAIKATFFVTNVSDKKRRLRPSQVIVCSLTGLHTLCEKRYDSSTSTITLFNRKLTIHRILMLCDKWHVTIPKSNFLWIVGDFFKLDDRINLTSKTIENTISGLVAGRSRTDLDLDVRERQGCVDNFCSKIIYYDRTVKSQERWLIEQCNREDYISFRNVVDLKKYSSAKDPELKNTMLMKVLTQTFNSAFFRGTKIRKVLLFYFGECFPARANLLKIVPEDSWDVFGIPMYAFLSKLDSMTKSKNGLALINGLNVNVIPNGHGYNITDVFFVGVVHDFQIISNILNSLFRPNKSGPRIWRFLPAEFQRQQSTTAVIKPNLGVEWSLEKEYNFFKSFTSFYFV